MDAELIIWIGIFLGGYTVALAYLLRIALSKDAGDRDARR
jgi:hypothetical protein